MFLGASQIDITPQPGVELSGFAARVQPSTGVLDPLFARAFYLVEGKEKLLWLHCDLVGFDRGIVLAFRRWANQALGLHEGQVMLSATHTHSVQPPSTCRKPAPTTWPMSSSCMAGCSRRPRRPWHPRNPSLWFPSGRLELAVDRRKAATANTDPRVIALGSDARTPPLRGSTLIIPCTRLRSAQPTAVSARMSPARPPRP